MPWDSVSPKPTGELRDLTRYRHALVQERMPEANRLHQVLTDVGIQVASIASNVLGMSGWAMRTAPIEGTTHAAILAGVWIIRACGRCPGANACGPSRPPWGNPGN